MKGVLVDFWPDTIDNLDELSNQEGIAKNELIRRGAESVLVLYGVRKSEVGEILLKDLRESDRILSSKPVNKPNLIHALSEIMVLSSLLSALYIVNDGKEQASIIRVYFRTIQDHLNILEDPDISIQKEQFETIREDIISFANILGKLQKVVITSSVRQK